MHLSLFFKLIKFSFILKAFTIKKIPVAILSLGASWLYIDVFKILFKNVEIKDIVLPIAAITVCLFIYFILWVVDFGTGMAASRYENKNKKGWVKSSKLYSSLGKIGAVLLIDFVLLMITLFLSSADMQGTAHVFLVISVGINVMAMLFEFQSVLENIERRTKKRTKFHGFFNRFIDLIEKLFAMRMTKLFGGSSIPETNPEDLQVNDAEDVLPEEKKEIKR